MCTASAIGGHATLWMRLLFMHQLNVNADVHYTNVLPLVLSRMSGPCNGQLGLLLCMNLDVRTLQWAMHEFVCVLL